MSVREWRLDTVGSVVSIAMWMYILNLARAGWMRAAWRILNVNWSRVYCLFRLNKYTHRTPLYYLYVHPVLRYRYIFIYTCICMCVFVLCWQEREETLNATRRKTCPKICQKFELGEEGPPGVFRFFPVCRDHIGHFYSQKKFRLFISCMWFYVFWYKPLNL